MATTTSKFRLQILSELHLEMPPPPDYSPLTASPLPSTSYSRFTIPLRAPHLALLGDIGVMADQDPVTGSLAIFLRQQLCNFDTVFYVPGNHEPYGSNWEAVNVWFDRFEAGLKRFGRSWWERGRRLGSSWCLMG
jgi:hypothetical protein